MTESSRDFELYLAARLREATARPGVTPAQASAYRRLLETARAHPERLEEEAGDMAVVLRAELVDLHQGLAHVYGLFPFSFRSEAHRRAAELIQGARTHADLAGLQARISEISAEGARRESELRFHMVDLFTGIAGWRSARPGVKAAFADQARSAWKHLVEIDPDLSWNKIRTFLPYRGLTPYSDEHFTLLETWFAEIAQ